MSNGVPRRPEFWRPDDPSDPYRVACQRFFLQVVEGDNDCRAKVFTGLFDIMARHVVDLANLAATATYPQARLADLHERSQDSLESAGQGAAALITDLDSLLSACNLAQDWIRREALNTLVEWADWIQDLVATDPDAYAWLRDGVDLENVCLAIPDGLLGKPGEAARENPEWARHRRDERRGLIKASLGRRWVFTRHPEDYPLESGGSVARTTTPPLMGKGHRALRKGMLVVPLPATVFDPTVETVEDVQARVIEGLHVGLANLAPTLKRLGYVHTKAPRATDVSSPEDRFRWLAWRLILSLRGNGLHRLTESDIDISQMHHILRETASLIQVTISKK